jgi:hypothetical protein
MGGDPVFCRQRSNLLYLLSLLSFCRELCFKASFFFLKLFCQRLLLLTSGVVLSGRKRTESDLVRLSIIFVGRGKKRRWRRRREPRKEKQRQGCRTLK